MSRLEQILIIRKEGKQGTKDGRENLFIKDIPEEVYSCHLAVDSLHSIGSLQLPVQKYLLVIFYL